MQRLSTAVVRKRLLKLAIELVSKEYTGINDLIECRCLRCDHVWPTRLRHINHGHSCPECGKKRQAQSKQSPAERIVAVLNKWGITVLRIHREKPRTRIDFRCDTCGVEDSALWNDLRRRGCPKCGRRRAAEARRHTYNYIKKFIADLGIELLSKAYQDSKSNLHVRFRCGCEGNASFNSIQRGVVCGNCAPNARVTIEDYRELARSHGGKIVTMARTTTQSSQWKCAKKNHPPFWRAYNVIKRNTFCPECNALLSERICRAAANQLFGDSFKKIRLSGVRGVGGRPLELDAYSRFLKLAIEHNGQQHYQPVRFGNQTQQEAEHCFYKQLEHDKRRREFCRAHGITLLEVPELGKTTKVDDLKEFIRTECQKANYQLPRGFDSVLLKFEAHNLPTTSDQMWERVLKRVRELDYTLKTKNYAGANSRLLLFCRSNHVYTPRVASFLKGHTCRRCLIQQLAIPVLVLPLGSKVVSRGYAGARIFDSMEECAKALGTTANNVQIVAKGRGNSCMGCGVARISLEQAKSFRGSKDKLEQFCRAKWPSPETYDRQDGSRKRLSKPVQFSDGRAFPSKAAAAKALGVTEVSVYQAVRTGRPCRGFTIREK